MACTTPWLWDTPPVIMHTASPFTRRNRAAARAATDLFSPWTMSGKALFWATRETTSESANTVHMEEMVMSSFQTSPT